MITSIRRFLLINLLLTITATTSLTAVGNYYFDQLDIQYHLDSLLSRAAFASNVLIKHNLKMKGFKEIQKELDMFDSKQKIPIDHSNTSFMIPNYENLYAFQVWSRDGKLLLKSFDAPKESLFNITPGFKDQNINGKVWRTYTLLDPETKLYFTVGEPYEVRNQLAHLITEDDLTIMLLMYPLSGVLIWFIIGKGLGSIQRTANEVSHRRPNYLDPVDESTIPIEIKPLVKEINKLFATLQFALDREKRFAADAAHELRTPLAGIKTQAQVAFKTTDEDERFTVLANVIHGIDRCTHIVNQLLTLSKLSSEIGGLDEGMEVNLPGLVREVIAQLVPQALEKNIDIELHVRDPNITIAGNATALNVLCRNLIDNAIRYSFENGKILVSIFRQGNKVLFQVTDNGPGIPPELRERVFERFFRILGTKGQGSGLGLSIVLQIARLHNALVKLGTPSNGAGLEITVEFIK